MVEYIKYVNPKTGKITYQQVNSHSQIPEYYQRQVNGSQVIYVPPTPETIAVDMPHVNLQNFYKQTSHYSGEAKEQALAYNKAIADEQERRETTPVTAQDLGMVTQPGSSVYQPPNPVLLPTTPRQAMVQPTAVAQYKNTLEAEKRQAAEAQKQALIAKNAELAAMAAIPPVHQMTYDANGEPHYIRDVKADGAVTTTRNPKAQFTVTPSLAERQRADLRVDLEDVPYLTTITEPDESRTMVKNPESDFLTSANIHTATPLARQWFGSGVSDLDTYGQTDGGSGGYEFAPRAPTPASGYTNPWETVGDPFANQLENPSDFLNQQADWITALDEPSFPDNPYNPPTGGGYQPAQGEIDFFS